MSPGLVMRVYKGMTTFSVALCLNRKLNPPIPFILEADVACIVRGLSWQTYFGNISSDGNVMLGTRTEGNSWAKNDSELANAS